ncbi:MAG: fibrobacter succinogenes major paralogous domain-containing protein [Cryomorphaceae bacterium]|nr:fibrobacter succinogenes major paralogous domain-containing protein [Cryomorphaceae bacterium]
MNRITFSLLLIFGMLAACKQDDETSEPDSPNITTGTVTDVDGNEYATIVIGDQEWMAENLKTTRYCNGDNLRNERSNSEWRTLNMGGWAYYNNDSIFEDSFGKLYNWYAVDDERNICPCGWHVPSNAEWEKLINYLGGDSIAGGKMKSAGTQYWATPNINASNESGFSGLPGGSRNFNATFDFNGQYGYWWQAKENFGILAWCRVLGYDNGEAITYHLYKTSGFSVRCIKD